MKMNGDDEVYTCICFFKTAALPNICTHRLSRRDKTVYPKIMETTSPRKTTCASSIHRHNPPPSQTKHHPTQPQEVGGWPGFLKRRRKRKMRRRKRPKRNVVSRPKTTTSKVLQPPLAALRPPNAARYLDEDARKEWPVERLAKEREKKNGVKSCPVLPACLLKHRVNDRTEYRAVPVCDEDEDRERRERQTKDGEKEEKESASKNTDTT
ncbi:hypothetical protein B0I37DRAFT_4541 [Chaetomium sp. MPI-CAGE-AT-0009]|nr:hypothetical protein B0I37DRAFT_4541 [Chaetomium sp. MPI-CAGE-AT-0009]